VSTPYSAAQLAEMSAFYDAHGAVHLPGLIEPAWCARILAAIDAAAAASTGAERIPGHAMSFGRGKGRMTIRYMWRENPLIREFLFRDRLAETVARVTGAKELRFWFDLTFVHNAHEDGSAGEGSPWHHDIAAFGWKGEKLPSLWMALTPAKRDNSPIEFIDRSHKTVPGFLSPPSYDPTQIKSLLPTPDFDALVREGKEKTLSWECEAGDAVIIHPFMVHGAKGNAGSRTGGRRVAITTRWMGDDVHWLPFDPATAKQASGEAPPPLGARPRGEWFPLIGALPVLFATMLAVGVAQTAFTAGGATSVVDYPDNSSRGKYIALMLLTQGAFAGFFAGRIATRVPEWLKDAGVAPDIALMAGFWFVATLGMIGFAFAWTGITVDRKRDAPGAASVAATVRAAFANLRGVIAHAQINRRFRFILFVACVLKSDFLIVGSFLPLWVVSVAA